jgi:hypothetical protein
MEPATVERAFAVAEEARGREWVLGEAFDFDSVSPPGIGRRGGFDQFHRVYWLGRRLQSIAGVPGADSLVARLIADDRAAESELTAVHLFQSLRPETDVEIGPVVAIGGRDRRPDFRLRSRDDSWTYVEVTQLRRSEASTRMGQFLERIAARVISVDESFLLEIVFWRDPTGSEEEALVNTAYDACRAMTGDRLDVGDLASLFAKAGDPAVVIPTILPAEDTGTRMSLARSVMAPGQANRQIVVRAPFADQRAKATLDEEAAQLPTDAAGLVMVDVTAQPTAFTSWPELVARRFTPVQHTRVGGVLLFSGAVTVAVHGLAWVISVKLMNNPHARIPVPAWILAVIDEMRAETQRATGRPD